VFNLTDALPTIDPDNEYVVTFYATAADLANTIPVANTGAFTTTTPVYTLYVKAVNSTGCIGIGTIELQAGHATELDLPDYTECEVNSPVAFDLASQQGAIMAILTPAPYQFSYYSNYNDAVDGTANNVLNPTLFLTGGSTTVYYRVVTPNSCPYIVKQLLTVVPKPDFDLKTMYEICKGETLSLTLPAGYYDYEWSDGTVGQNAAFTATGTYSATITTLHGGVTCQTTQGFIVNVYDAPYVSDVITTDFAGNNNSITILPFSPNNLYALNGGDYGQDNIFTGLEGGLYTIYVKDKGGCGVTAKTVAVLNYPNFFTPNADGQADYWHIKFAVTARVIVTIFDRYGKLITTVKPNDRGWDGTFNGHPMPANDYWFVIQQQDGSEYRGHFSLIR
jgi:gliding motility-associated-like protein